MAIPAGSRDGTQFFYEKRRAVADPLRSSAGCVRESIHAVELVLGTDGDERVAGLDLFLGYGVEDHVSGRLLDRDDDDLQLLSEPAVAQRSADERAARLD